MIKCPFCGTMNPAGEEFCENCGGELHASPPASGVSAAPIAPPPSPIKPVNPTPFTGSNTTGSTTFGGSGGSGRLVPQASLQNGRYVVDKILGQGGMGTAVLAHDTRVSNKRVVIKELISDGTDPAQRQEDVRNFEREVETLANLDHPLIPTVTDSFQEGSRYYMVQEYAPGENLEDYMERTHKAMPEEEALTYISQVLDILVYLGQQKPPIVHRDIKPANIIISSKDKRARLVDFGIARADEIKNAKHKQTTALGTPGYAPPEQYQGNADPRSDLYALAATLHHLVTNRDPREYPPFAYPPARSLNPQVSPELERILEHALTVDINKRYQNAAAMKYDIDALLQQRFHTSGDTSSYVLSTSGPITLPPANTYGPVNTSRAAQSPYQGAGTRQGFAGGPGVPQQPQMFAPQPQPLPRRQQRQNSGNGYFRWSFLLLIAVIVIIAVLLYGLPALSHIASTSGNATPTNNGGSTSSSSTAPATPANPISTQILNGEKIGLSYGNDSFDTNTRPVNCASCQAKSQGSAALKANNSGSATSYWHAALSADSSDAEADIYLANQAVLNSGKPYITVVVVTMLTGTGADVGVGRDNLQGAYLAQQEFNASNSSVQLRLLIANVGGSNTYATTIANQIEQAAQADSHIVGMVGWPYSSYTSNAISAFASAKIQLPLISASASSDNLSNSSPYFFRVAPSNLAEAQAGASYAKTHLNAKTAVVFIDNGDAYSQNLGSDFKSTFTTAGGQVLQTVTYTVGNSQSVISALNSITKSPDLIYFSGYSNDMNTVLTELPNHSNLAQTRLLGGDALYNLGGYDKVGRASFSRLHFTAFAYPDEWGVLGYSSKTPAFYQDYKNTYNTSNPNGGVYGYTRADSDVVLNYDATQTMLLAAKGALNGGTTLKPADLLSALQKINGKNAIQGVSGQISFDSQGNAANKAVVILNVSSGGTINMESQLGSGTFLVPQS